MPSLKHLKAIVFDWAGTMIDHGSRAPAIVFQEIFRDSFSGRVSGRFSERFSGCFSERFSGRC